MPRNKSEKRTSCPEAMAYVHASRRCLLTGDKSRMNQAWAHMPNWVGGRILTECGSRHTADSEAIWRHTVIAFIETNFTT